MHARLLDFVGVARSAGIAISTSQSIAAFDAVRLVGFDDRDVFKDALALTLATTAEERARFERCFEMYFGVNAGAMPTPPSEPAGASQTMRSPAIREATENSTLTRILLDDDRAALVRNLHAAAAAASAGDVRLFTQTGAFTRRILEQLGIEAFDAALERLRSSGDREQSVVANFLAERRSAVALLARDLVERRLAARGPAEAERLHDRFLREARLANIERRDVERMRALVRAMARRLATRYGRTRTRARRGELDMSATMRRNVAFDGVPFDIVWKRRKIRKPRLVVLCDVSGSVARLASFMLLFASELAGVVADVRSFAFSDSLIEVTGLLARGSIEEAGEEIMRSIGFHSSSYGHALADFERSHMAGVDRKTTVVILGDARTNYGDPRVDVVRALRDRAKRVVWLNPEPRGSWGTDDSEMLRYLPYCALARTCNSLLHLEDVVEDLVRDAS